MCGFAGFLGGLPSEQGNKGEASLLQAMNDAIATRGPDDSGVWFDEAARIGLGHRRLAIVDLSAAGHQPMNSASGRYVIIFNGEIYNHLALRQALETAGAAPRWRGHSDTETLLAGFDVWGVEETVKRAIGMFAFAIWDRERRSLTLGRDRLGEKPLYFGWQGQGKHAVFLFGSELKALRVHPQFEKRVNRGALSLQLRHSYVPAPYSIYEGISKLSPGCLLTVSLDTPTPHISPYWSAIGAIEDGVRHPINAEPVEVVDQLEDLLKSAVRQQMMADVPLGAFLSGGVDSSVVVALMQAQSSRPVRTFSIGFHEEGYDEAKHAKAVAAHLGTDHTELYITPQQAMDVIERLPSLYDEPFSDSSQIPTYLVSQLARRDVTVSLSGDAGDELFCGYTRYQMAGNLWNNIASTPVALRKLAARGLTTISPQGWDGIAKVTRRLLPQALRYAKLGDKIHKGAAVLTSESLDALYLSLVSHWQDSDNVVFDAGHLPTLLAGNSPSFNGLDNIQRMMALDLLTYLPDDILAKVDRAAMGVSLETRVPFLDHRVVEFAWRLPQSLKMRNGVSKWALREVLYRHVPKSLIERPKMGFGVPVGDWLRGPLRDWAESLLDEKRLRDEGFFRPELLRDKWAQHLSGERNWQYHLWDVLMFQAWSEQNS